MKIVILSTKDSKIAIYLRQLYYLPKIVKLPSTEDEELLSAEDSYTI